MDRLCNAVLTVHAKVAVLDPAAPRYWKDVADAATNVFTDAANLRGIARHAAQTLERAPTPTSAGLTLQQPRPSKRQVSAKKRRPHTRTHRPPVCCYVTPHHIPPAPRAATS